MAGEETLYTAMGIEEEERLLGRWPRRLLHVPTLVSYDWEHGNHYNGIKEPRYNAITYTWGRYRLKDHPEREKPTVQSVPIRINSHGERWSIPRVDPEHFSAEEFANVIQATTMTGEGEDESDAGAVEFLWLDVACIDQREGDSRSAAEIGRQAVIFYGAARVFVWLTTLDRVGLIDAMQSIRNACSEKHASNDLKHQSVIPHILTLLSDPWFSSLWTLQEAFLRRDAFLLARDAKPASVSLGKIDSGWSWHSWEKKMDQNCFQLSDIIELLEKWTTKCYEVKMNPPSDMYAAALDLIVRRGIRAFQYGNELSMYEAAMQRTASRPEDRIYGIQQIFDFRLGKSAIGAQLGQDLSLRNLENQFGEALVTSKPVISQLHVFTQDLPAYQRWKLNSSSRIVVNNSVRLLKETDISWRADRCSFSVDHSATRRKPVMFSGQMAPLETLMRTYAKMWELLYPLPKMNSLLAEMIIQAKSQIFFRFDAVSELQGAPSNPAGAYPPQGESAAQWLLERYPNNQVQVLLLGRWGPSTTMDLSGEGAFNHGTFGLVLLDYGEGRWARLGICQWGDADVFAHRRDEVPETAKAFVNGDSDEWMKKEGVFGYLD